MEEILSEANEIKTNAEELADFKQPEAILNVEMRDYQLYGCNWILSRFAQGANCILGDEMGLGKTLQSISVMAHLHDVEQIRPPFLVLAPLSLIENWYAELGRYCPTLRVVRFIGAQDQRLQMKTEIVEHIKSQPTNTRKDPGLNFDVFLTSTDLVLKESQFLQRFKWRLLVVDEAHRLKNSKSVLYTTLKEMKYERILLMTGTPIQNNLSELWALLHFLRPSLFSDEKAFLQHFAPISTQASANAGQKKSKQTADLEQTLHSLLRPFLLRRTKEEVLKDLPGKKEIILYTGLSAMQKKYYKLLLTRDPRVLSNNKSALMNVIMNLRKCCNHPYLFDGAEPMEDGEFKLGQHIVDNSGKLVVLDKLLTHMLAEGKKVLIFSQMTQMLDIIQDYLHYRQYSYERLDGSVRGEERFLAVKNFQQEDTFVFLLSTRAGGLGLNLTAASVVVFMDSDWNPQQDLQAAARAHRLGQTNEVTIFRLVSANTVEEIILARALKKLKLKHSVLDRGRFGHEEGDETEVDEEFKLTDVVRFGLKALCEDAESTITEDDIETILSKGKVVDETKNLQRIDGDAVATATATATASISSAPATIEDDDDQADEPKAANPPRVARGPTITEADNMYFFEGTDYSKDRAGDDESAFEALRQDFDEEAETGLTLLLETQLGVTGLAPAEPIGEISRSARRQRRKRTLTEMQEETTEDKEEASAAKRRKKEAKWKEFGYESLAIREEDLKAAEGAEVSALKADENLAPVNPDAILDDEDESEAAALVADTVDAQFKINFLTGDATKPQGPKSSAIIVNCLDNSGKWGKGGFFNAIRALSPKIEENYSMSHDMGDLHLGDVHLVEIGPRPNGDDGSKLYVANMVVQSRNKGVVSAIHLKHLSAGLAKLSAKAKQLNATVHMPRIGAHLPSTDWYSIEKMVRAQLSAKRVKTFIYYFPRGGGGGGKAQGHKPKASAAVADFEDDENFDFPVAATTTTTTKSTPLKKRISGFDDEDVEMAEEEPKEERKAGRAIVDDEDMDVVQEKPKPAKKVEPKTEPKSTPMKKTVKEGKAQEEEKESPVGQIFAGLRVALYHMGAHFIRIKAAIKANGGAVDGSVGKATTHVVTTKKKIDDLLAVQLRATPKAPVVSVDWIDKSIAVSQLLPTEEYQIK